MVCSGDLPGGLMRGVVDRALSLENTLLLLRQLLPSSHSLSVLAASPSAHFFPFCAVGKGRGWGKEGKEVYIAFVIGRFLPEGF